jgi:hypothetical protein
MSELSPNEIAGNAICVLAPFANPRFGFRFYLRTVSSCPRLKISKNVSPFKLRLGPWPAATPFAEMCYEFVEQYRDTAFWFSLARHQILACFYGMLKFQYFLNKIKIQSVIWICPF